MFLITTDSTEANSKKNSVMESQLIRVLNPTSALSRGSVVNNISIVAECGLSFSP